MRTQSAKNMSKDQLLEVVEDVLNVSFDDKGNPLDAADIGISIPAILKDANLITTKQYKSMIGDEE